MCVTTTPYPAWLRRSPPDPRHRFDDEGGHGSAGEIDPEDIERGGEFTIGVSDEIEPLNPLTASTAHTIDLLGLVYQPGAVVDPSSFEIQP